MIAERLRDKVLDRGLGAEEIIQGQADIHERTVVSEILESRLEQNRGRQRIYVEIRIVLDNRPVVQMKLGVEAGEVGQQRQTDQLKYSCKKQPVSKKVPAAEALMFQF